MYEGIIFAAFLGISLVAHGTAEYYEHRKARTGEASPFSHHRAGVLTLLAPFCIHYLTHPAFWHAVKEYIIHLVVYSGLVIPGH